jgi:hypothetical protein
MKSSLLIIALIAVSAYSYSFTADEHEFLWEAFRVQHGKTYDNAFEAMRRFKIFKDNLEVVKTHNDAKKSWTMGMNEFGDLTHAEFKAKYVGGYKKRAVRKAGVKLSTVGVPTSIDWSAKGAVTAIKNQQQCGSCWAFSTTGSVEGISFIKTGQLPNLSEQQLVDCSTQNNGCNGGLMDYAFEYIVQNGGIGSESAYPYTAADGTCKKVAAAATISGHTDVAASDEDALQAAVAQQPVSVAIEADQMGFQFYSGGVFDGSCGTNLDHGVLAVGYGTESGKDYWKVKNSWGATWGSQGYILLARGTGKGNGQCGIAMQPSYPTKSAALEVENNAVPVGQIWSSCGKSTDILSNLQVQITPNPPVKGQDVTVAASGTLSESITSGAKAQLTISVLGIPVINKSIDLCTADPSITCPIAAGAQSIKVTQMIPSTVPSGDYTGKVVATNADGKEITCVNLQLKF